MRTSFAKEGHSRASFKGWIGACQVSKGRERAFQADEAAWAKEQIYEATWCIKGVGVREMWHDLEPERLVNEVCDMRLWGYEGLSVSCWGLLALSFRHCGSQKHFRPITFWWANGGWLRRVWQSVHTCEHACAWPDPVNQKAQGCGGPSPADSLIVCFVTMLPSSNCFMCLSWNKKSFSSVLSFDRGGKWDPEHGSPLPKVTELGDGRFPDFLALNPMLPSWCHSAFWEAPPPLQSWSSEEW